MSSGNRTLKRAIQRAGLEKPAKAIYWLLKPEYRHFVAARRRDLKDNDHLRLLLAFTLREDANCIDIGSQRGEILEDIVRIAPQGEHHAFEPIPELAGELRRRFPSVQVHEVALSDNAGVREFVHVTDAEGYSGLHARDLAGKHSLHRFDVRVARLDDVLPANYDAAFIKLDVEGAELQVLEGGLRTLRRCHPIVWFEHGAPSAAHYGATSNDVWDLLCGELEYRIFNAEGEGPLDRKTFSSGTGRWIWNFIATS